ncbi:MAG: NAD(P)H-dependent oxidoreductase, partial [Deltaproteobacteria bacterium]|nr:NAD(P)H-dependent oxidoreductase [Deltaproteobacteria bacterium]
HPALHRSRANRRLAEAARGIDGVTVHDLYDAYPDFDVDVAREQALLAAHRAVVAQFPMYWYSTPALLKQWQDLVLEFGWAYGPSGTALEGRSFGCAVTTGGPEHAYQHHGFNRVTVGELLVPLERTATLCRMRWRPPWVLHGAHRLDDAELGDAAARYRAALVALVAEVAPEAA